MVLAVSADRPAAPDQSPSGLGVIRPARPTDVDDMVAMVKELADFERALDEAVLTSQQLTNLLFGDRPAVFAYVVEGEGDELAGFAIYFRNFSTWLGRLGIYLEDLYVRPQYRRYGFGRRLLGTLARECVERGYGRFEWSVLDWNTNARDFYEAHGAVAMDEWTVHRVTGPALEALAAYADESSQG